MTLYAAHRELVTPSFKFNRIVKSLQNTITKLEAFADSHEKKAEDYLQAHLNVKALADKARTTADNIGKLFG